MFIGNIKTKENKNQKELSQIEKSDKSDKKVQYLKAKNTYLKHIGKNRLVDEEK